MNGESSSDIVVVLVVGPLRRKYGDEKREIISRTSRRVKGGE